MAFVSMPPVGGHGNRVTRWGSRSIFTLKFKFQLLSCMYRVVGRSENPEGAVVVKWS